MCQTLHDRLTKRNTDVKPFFDEATNYLLNVKGNIIVSTANILLMQVP